jgi:hypothetical protein
MKEVVAHPLENHHHFSPQTYHIGSFIKIGKQSTLQLFLSNDAVLSG